MTRDRVAYRLALASVCGGFLFSFIVSILADQQKLPSFWTTNEDGRGDKDQTYRLRAEIELLKGKKSYFIEEWAAGAVLQSRLDLIDTANGARTSFLTDGKTKEKFRYQPFTCSSVSDFSKALPTEFAGLFPVSNEDGTFLATGVGSLWLHALKLESTYRKPNKLVDGRAISSSGRMSAVLDSMGKYQVQPTVAYPYRVSFYFREELGKGPDSLVLIQVEERTSADSSYAPVMRIKILEFDESIRTETGSDGLEVFELPLGYGCAKNIQLDHPIKSPIAQFSAIAPHVLQMEVVARVPLDESHELERWKSHSVSLRLVSGQLSLGNKLDRDFIILESEDYAPVEPLTSQDSKNPRKVQLRRIKRVWDLGQGGLDWKGPKEPAVWYEIDERRSKCIGQGETKMNLTGSVAFPLGDLFKKAAIQSDTDETSKNEGTNNKGRLASNGIALTTHLMYQLLSTADLGYEPVKDVTKWTANMVQQRQVAYEKRVENFEMHDHEGNLLWFGPVSMVRQYRYDLSKKAMGPSTGENFADQVPKTSGTIYFLSPDSAQLVGTINVELIEARAIHWGAMHRELDVSLCFDQMFNRNLQVTRYLSEQHASKNLVFTVNYPIELDEDDDGVDKLATCNQCQMSVYEQFLLSMASVSGGRLDLLQMVNVDIDFGPKMLKISGELLARPHLLNYRRIESQKFSETRQNLLFTELKGNEESCAESCAHYNCPVFSYCASSQRCDLLLQADTWLLLNPTGYVHDPLCTVFRAQSAASKEPSDDKSASKTHKAVGQVSPAGFVSALNEAIKNEQADRPSTSIDPLALWLEYSIGTEQKRKVLTLRPSSVESSTLDASRTISEMLDGDDASDAKRPTTNALASADPVRPEYELVLEQRRLVRPPKSTGGELFPVGEAKATSYEDCESLCAELDCNSFSHCQIEQTCQVSQLHESSMLREHSEHADYCFVMARDYLSKFKSATVRSLYWPPIARKKVQVAESRDCATRCVEEKEFKCVSFFFLDKREPTEPNCYLRQSHMAPTQYPDSDERYHDSCTLYTRSYLAEFDKFYGKALPVLPEGHEAASQLTIKGLGAEGCGAECAKLQGDCHAFHTCRPKSVTDAAGEQKFMHLQQRFMNLPLCVIQVSTKQPAPTRSMLLEQLVADDDCTAFVVAQKSELNRLAANSPTELLDWDENGDPLDGARMAELAPSQSGWWWWLKGMALAFTGLIVGYVAVFALGLRR